MSVSQDKTWVDPLVGLTLRSPGQHRVHLQVYTEIGGFGAGSDFTWQIFPTLGFKFTDHFSLRGPGLHRPAFGRGGDAR